jgi:hypothetical protein
MGRAGIAGEQDRRGRGMAEGYPLGGRVTNKQNNKNNYIFIILIL